MRVAVITGAGRGIGAATARLLATQGWALALGDVCGPISGLAYELSTRDDLEAVAESCRSLGVPVVAQPCDVRSDEDLQALIGAADALGDVQACVAVAGVLGGGGLAWEISDDVIERDLAVNYLGVLRTARAVVPTLLGVGGLGRFVAVVSTAGTTGLPQLSSYSASKHAALGYVKSLAADLAWSGVTANAVLPGSTETTLLEATAAAYDLGSGEEFARHQRIGRLITPAEIASAVAWLVSPGASAITGTAVSVDGGFTG